MGNAASQVEDKSDGWAQPTNSDNLNLRYSSFIDNNIECIWRVDLDQPILLGLPAEEQVELLHRHGYFAEVNQAMAEQYGFSTPEEVIGFRLTQAMPSDLPTTIPKLMQVVESKYRIKDWESIERDKFGNEKIFLNNLTGEISQGMLLRIWGSARDITRENDLERENQLRSEAFEQVSDGCVIVEALSERIIYLNKAFTKITGYAASDIPGEKLSFLQGPETDRDTVSKVRSAIASEQPFLGEILNYRKDGTAFWNQMRISPIRDAEGKATHFVGILSDITDSKRTRDKLHEQRQQLAHVGRVAVMGELTAALAHELKQPLAAILSNAQAAQRFLGQANPDLDELREILKDIVVDDKRAGEVIDRLLRMARKEGEDFQRIRINDLVEETHRLMLTDLAVKGLNARLQLTPRLPEVWGDPVQLQQVLVNLIMNACQEMQDLQQRARKLLLATRGLEDGTVEISVADSGRGIDDKMLEGIFRPFYSTKDGGMGMGLAISRTLVESFGGKIRAENGPDQGAVFRIQMPAAQ